MKYLLLSLLFFTLSLFVAIGLCNATEPVFITDTEKWLTEPDPPLAKSWWNKLFIPAVPYDTTEKVLLGTLVVANAGDAITTISGVDRGAVELNPVFGDHPSTGKVVAIKAVAITAMVLCANQMTPKIRKVFLGATSLLFAGVTLHNLNVLKNMD